MGNTPHPGQDEALEAAVGQTRLGGILVIAEDEADFVEPPPGTPLENLRRSPFNNIPDDFQYGEDEYLRDPTGIDCIERHEGGDV